MISQYFKPDELAALMNHCLQRMSDIDAPVKREGRKRNLQELERFNFWDALYVKLETVFRHPVCVWCDARDWDLDDPNTIPDEGDLPPHEHLFVHHRDEQASADAAR